MPAAQTIHVPAGLPIDEVTRTELLDVGRANRRSVNVRQTDRLALERRLGFGELTRDRLGADPRAAGRRLFAHKGVPMVIDGAQVDAYADEVGCNVGVASVVPCSVRVGTAPAMSANPSVTDVEYCNGLLAVVTSDEGPPEGRASVAIIQAHDGAVVRPPEIVFEPEDPDNQASVFSYGGTHFVLVTAYSAAGGEGRIAVHALDVSSQAGIEAGWVELTTDASGGEDVLAIFPGAPVGCSLDDRVAIAFGIDGGVGGGVERVYVQTYDASGLIEQRALLATIGGDANPASINMHGSTDGTLWVAWSASTAVFCIGLDASALTTTLADNTFTQPIDVTSGAARVYICEGPTAGTARLFAVDTNSTPQMHMRGIQTTDGDVATDGSQVTVYNAMLLGPPFVHSGRYYAPAATGLTHNTVPQNDQGLLIFVDCTDDVPYLTPIANVQPGLNVGTRYVCKTTRIGDTGRYVYATSTIRSGGASRRSVESGLAVRGVDLITLDFAARSRWQTTEHANATFVGGGLTCVFTGAHMDEVGFLGAPTKPVGATDTGSLNGTFRYVAYYETVDDAGNWVVGGISQPSDPVVASNDKVTVTTAPLTISRRLARGAVRVGWARTLDGGEPPYYRIGSSPVDPTQATVTFEDTTSDAVLATRPKIYAPNLPGAVGEALDRRAPPGLEHVVTYAGMVVGAQSSSVYWSGQEVYGEATWFSPVFELPVTNGGDITALAAQDGSLFIFKRDRILSVTGEAPSDNGLAGGLGVPRLLASDVGCVDASSVVVTSLGIFFRSARGIELLNRSQQVEEIGEPIARTTDAYPVTTSAVLDERSSLVRFSLAQSEAGGAVSGDGVTAVFDLTSRQWVSTDIVRGVSLGEPAQSAAMVRYDGVWRYAWLGADGTLYVERDEDDPSAYLDGASWIPVLYELPPLKLGLQQEQRVYECELLFERHGAAGLLVEVASDFASYDPAADKVWTEEVTLGRRQVSFRPRPRGGAVQFRISDTEPAVVGNGRGLAFVGLSADIAPEQRFTRGTPRLSAAVRR